MPAKIENIFSPFSPVSTAAAALLFDTRILLWDPIHTRDLRFSRRLPPAVIPQSSSHCGLIQKVAVVYCRSLSAKVLRTTGDCLVVHWCISRTMPWYPMLSPDGPICSLLLKSVFFRLPLLITAVTGRILFCHRKKKKGRKLTGWIWLALSKFSPNAANLYKLTTGWKLAELYYFPSLTWWSDITVTTVRKLVPIFSACRITTRCPSQRTFGGFSLET